MKRVFEAQNIADYFKTKKEGDAISYAELQKYTHYDLSNYIENQRFKKGTMLRVKNILIDNGIIIKAIANEGYYVLKSNQIQSYAYRTYIKRPLKQLEKSKRILESTNMKKLKQNEWEKHTLALELNNELLKTNNNILNSNKFKELDN